MCESVILLVDDDEALREPTAMLLQEACDCGGCTVMQAADGRAGLVLARTRRPDVIVSDVDMPVMSGEAMVAALRQDPELCDVPVLLISGRDNLSGLVHASGADAYLHKPLDGEALLATVERLRRGRSDSGPGQCGTPR